MIIPGLPPDGWRGGQVRDPGRRWASRMSVWNARHEQAPGKGAAAGESRLTCRLPGVQGGRTAPSAHTQMGAGVATSPHSFLQSAMPRRRLLSEAGSGRGLSAPVGSVAFPLPEGAGSAVAVPSPEGSGSAYTAAHARRFRVTAPRFLLPEGIRSREGTSPGKWVRLSGFRLRASRFFLRSTLPSP
jgi:hypothetical protein